MMKRLYIFVTLIFLFSCQNKNITIDWEEDKAFKDVLVSAGEKYVMIDFVKDG
jgi:hypothetical protein